MKIVRLQTSSGAVYAELRDGKYYKISGDVFGYFKVTSETVEGKILVPVTPSKIVALGINYRKHADEFGQAVKPEPLIFLKPPSSLIADNESIVLPPNSGRVEHEGELAVVIGRRCKDVEADEAKDYIFGYTCAYDVSERDIQKRDEQWTRAKGFDTFCPLGYAIETELDPDCCEITVTVNGEVRQHGSTREMVNNVYDSVAFISKVMTLEAGDVILTGTPAGVSPIRAGDVVTVTIEGVGTLTNPVK